MVTAGKEKCSGGQGRIVLHQNLMGLILLLLLSASRPALAMEAQELVQGAWDQFRGQASRSEVSMTIHRPDWERTLKMKAWTEGRSLSLIRITAPAKDRGNGTLKRKQEMWTYNPKINRVIKLPPSMMAQSWMGSDFSNNDLAKSDSILEDYTHRITGREQHAGKTVYLLESVPKPGAPVVWGMQRLKIREDFILLSEEFLDEELQPVKIMTTSDIQTMGERLFPKIWIMRKAGADQEYTRLEHHWVEFLDDLPDRLFTLRRLRSPVRR